MTGEKYRPYVECNEESRKGPLLPYGCGDGDGESFRVDYDSTKNDSGDIPDIKIVADDGSISYIEARKPVSDEPKYDEPDLAE